MNVKTVKKLLIAALAAILLVVLIFTACATTEPASPPLLNAAPGDGEQAKETGLSEDVFGSAEVTSTVSVGGVLIKSQISGAYSVKGFAGFAVRMGSDAIKGLAGISGTPYVRAYDITAKKNAAIFASINGEAASVGATVLGAISVELGQMSGGKFSTLPPQVVVPATIGVAQAGGRTLAVVKVLPGGATEILQDTDENSMTVTFPITGGLASYAVIAY